MKKQELIEKLLGYKADLQNSYCDLDSIISDVMSDVCDYDQDNDYKLDSYTYYYETDDCIEDYITSFVQTNGVNALKNILDAVDGDYSWYHIDDVYGDIIPRDFGDVEEWIDDILSELGDDEDETSD